MTSERYENLIENFYIFYFIWLYITEIDLGVHGECVECNLGPYRLEKPPKNQLNFIKMITIGIPIQMDIVMLCNETSWNNFNLWDKNSTRILSTFLIIIFLNRTSVIWIFQIFNPIGNRSWCLAVRKKRVRSPLGLNFIRNDKKLSSNWWICTQLPVHTPGRCSGEFFSSCAGHPKRDLRRPMFCRCSIILKANKWT